LYLLWLGGWPYAGLILVASAICVFEMAAMVNPGDRFLQVSLAAIGVLFVLAAMTGWLAQPTAILIAAFLPIAIFTLFLFRVCDISTVASRGGLSVAGVLWAGGLFSCGCLRFVEDGGAWVFLACILSWLSDTGAYFAGRWFGRHKLYETVSPKKTWEGAIGGV